MRGHYLSLGVEHLVRVAVVSGDDEVSARCPDGFRDLSDAGIDGFHCRGQYRDDEPMVQIDSNVTKEAYMDMVKRAKEYITAGDIFQVVLSQRYEIDNPPDSFEVYRRLRATNPSPYLYYFKTQDYEISGASPELLVKVTDGLAATRPIAGTRPRGKTKQEDLAL